MAPVVAALDVLEDAALAALAALSPAGSAWWWQYPPPTLARLASGQLARAYILQHQDGGGRPAPRLGSEGWEGLIVVRVLSAVDATARDGRDLAVAAMLALASPAGYHIQVAHDRPIAVASVNHIMTGTTQQVVTRASQLRATIRTL